MVVDQEVTLQVANWIRNLRSTLITTSVELDIPSGKGHQMKGHPDDASKVYMIQINIVTV